MHIDLHWQGWLRGQYISLNPIDIYSIPIRRVFSVPEKNHLHEAAQPLIAAVDGRFGVEDFV